MKQEILKYINSLSNDMRIKEILIETIGKILLKYNNIELFLEKNNEKIIHVYDWISSVVENNEKWKIPRVLTLDALNNSADKYFEKKNNKLQTIELDENQEKLIDNLDDYYIVQMLTPKALDKESKVMQHCIGHGGYDYKLRRDKYKFLSLRDKYNKAHVTLEINEDEVVQLQGKQNTVPDFKYLEKLVPWLIKNGKKINLIRCNLVLNKKDNRIYSKNALPDDLIVDGNLDLNDYQLEKLPDNLIVNGNLSLYSCQNLKKLPKNLKVEKNIYFLGLTFKQDIFPTDWFNNKSVGIDDFINYLSDKKMNIVTAYNEKYSFLYNENDKKFYLKDNLPENCLLLKSASFYKSKVMKLPNKLFVKGDLNLSNTKIKELPEYLTVTHNLDLCNMNIDYIPENIEIGKCLDITNSKIKKLPDNLKCEKIFIDPQQVDLIKETINFKKIIIKYESYSKEEFFREKNINHYSFLK